MRRRHPQSGFVQVSTLPVSFGDRHPFGGALEMVSTRSPILKSGTARAMSAWLTMPTSALPSMTGRRRTAWALPPLRPAALCWAVVPPWFDLPDPLYDFSPPCLDAFGEFAIFAARCLDMPLSLSASYWSLFLTLADFDGMAVLLRWLVDQW